MDLPKCRTCGERHRLGPCPSTSTKAVNHAKAPSRPEPARSSQPISRSDQVQSKPQVEIRQDVSGSAGHVAIDKAGPVRNPERKQPKAKPASRPNVPKPDRVVTRRATPRSVATTSENLDVTAGETAPKFDRVAYHRGYMKEYMRKRRQKESKK